MKTIKTYVSQEINNLVIRHNALVKPEYHTNNKGMLYLLSEADDDQSLVLPYFEISSNETLSGHAEIFELEWAAAYVVAISHEGGFFFADENNESCDGSQDHWIDSLDVAKNIFSKNNYGKVELLEYEFEDCDEYIVLENKSC